MNQLLPYEISIGKKMEELPVPEMADLIWANIQHQLNLDLHGIQEKEKDLSQKDTLKIGNIIEVVVGLIIIILVFILIVPPKREVKQNSKPEPKSIVPQRDSLHSEKGVLKTVPLIKQDGIIEVKDSSNPDDSVNVIIQDVTPLQLKPDSITVSKSDPAKVSKTVIEPIVLPKKKTIGVTGINDSSYRISSKKDSSK